MRLLRLHYSRNNTIKDDVNNVYRLKAKQRLCDCRGQRCHEVRQRNPSQMRHLWLFVLCCALNMRGHRARSPRVDLRDIGTISSDDIVLSQRHSVRGERTASCRPCRSYTSVSHRHSTASERRSDINEATATFNSGVQLFYPAFLRSFLACNTRPNDPIYRCWLALCIGNKRVFFKIVFRWSESYYIMWCSASAFSKLRILTKCPLPLDISLLS